MVLLNYAQYSLFTRQASDQFRRSFLSGELSPPLPDPQVVFIGDSSAKTSMSPLAFGTLSSVNLSVNKGNAMTAYMTMEEYLLSRTPPRCVILISQFNWKHSYRDFFNIGVKQKLFSITEIFSIARQGFRGNFFPADTYNPVSFWLNAALYYLQIAEPPWAEIQNVAWGRESKTHTRKRPTVNQPKPLGFWGLPAVIVPEDDFFSSDFHPQLLENFVPSESENFYLNKLAKLAEKHKFSLYVAALPIAFSPYVEQSLPFRSHRRTYLHWLFHGKPNVKLIDFPPVAERKYFYDLSHPNVFGAKLFTSWVYKHVKDHCSSVYRQEVQKSGYTKGDKTGAKAKNAKTKAKINKATTTTKAADTF